MITIFEKFLNEYSGNFGTVGFRYSNPSKEYTLKLDMKYTPKNEDVIKDILSNYDISYEDIKLERPFFSSLQTLSLKFLTYSELEAAAIINSLLVNLNKNDVKFDTSSLQTYPEINNPFKRKEIKGFGK